MSLGSVLFSGTMESETTEKRLSEQIHLESSESSVLSVWCLPLEATKDYSDNLYCLGSRFDYLDHPFQRRAHVHGGRFFVSFWFLWRLLSAQVD